MDFKEGKEKFIETWGILASSWGVPRTMAQIHALLLVEKGAMNTETIMEKLEISRGNAHMNLKELLDWELIFKESHEGCRKDYYFADRNIWEVFRKIAIQRKKRELEPVIRALDELSEVNPTCQESEDFQKMIQELKLISSKADVLLEKVVKTESSWLIKGISKLVS